jgi:hypothetical protein
MEIGIKESGKTVENIDKEHRLGRMEVSMKESEKTV